MARRNEHTHDQLREMAIVAGKAILAEDGFSKFSARKVAKGIGYTIGTIYNIFENHDQLILCINAKTLDDMHAHLVKNKKAKAPASTALINLATSYIHFADANYHCWSALFEHSLPQNMPLPEWYSNKMKGLYSLIEEPLLPFFASDIKKAEQTAQILWAGVHGICQLGLTGKLDEGSVPTLLALSSNLIEYYMKGLERFNKS